MSKALHIEEYIRDIPRSCVCEWRWDSLCRRYRRSERYAQLWITDFCPWHGQAEARQP